MTRNADDERESNRLGDYLKDIRQAKRLTLRQVEKLSENDISNAYLSQLENNKITKPSPNILHRLSDIYGISYEDMMARAGYVAAARPRADGERHGRVATFAGEHLTSEEEDELLKYLAFLRTKRGR